MNLDVEGKLVDFMTDTASTLGRIEQFQSESLQDRRSIHGELNLIRNQCATCSVKISAMELGLNNHISTHDRITRYVLYPVAVTVLLSALGIFFKLVLHVF